MCACAAWGGGVGGVVCGWWVAGRGGAAQSFVDTASMSGVKRGRGRAAGGAGGGGGGWGGGGGGGGGARGRRAGLHQVC
jgi:hypothetical protein